MADNDITLEGPDENYPDWIELYNGGETYYVYYGGSPTGTVKDGPYIGGTYTGGSSVGSFTA